VLDPFDVYAQGEDVLSNELTALDEGHLRNIILAYRLAPAPAGDLSLLDRAALADMILAGVRRRES
jgi:hypothetical protein